MEKVKVSKSFYECLKKLEETYSKDELIDLFFQGSLMCLHKEFKELKPSEFSKIVLIGYSKKLEGKELELQEYLKHLKIKIEMPMDIKEKEISVIEYATVFKVIRILELDIF